MDERVIKFLKRHRISVLTTLLKNGQPHSAALHYAANFEPFYFIFFTDISSRKMEGLIDGKPGKASLVIGFNEEEWLTMQLEGEVRWVPNSDEFERTWEIYASKFNGVEKNKSDSNAAIITFTPKWWRYTEVKPSPAVKISSED